MAYAAFWRVTASFDLISSHIAIAKGGLAIGKSSYMPAWGETLSDQQIMDIIAHVRSLPLHSNP